MLSTIQTGDRCQLFETSFIAALVMDFVIVQPLVVVLTYLYRYLQSDLHNKLWSELHPFDGAERVM